MKFTAGKHAAWATVLAAAILLVLLVLLYSQSRQRILFPPEITAQVLQQTQPDVADLLVKNSDAGVYRHGCRYELQPDGGVTLADTSCWQSYDRTISDSLYRRLRRLPVRGRLLQVSQSSGGWLAIFGADDSSVRTVVETDPQGTELFRYELDAGRYASPALAAVMDGDMLYVLSYRRKDDRLYIDSVSKTTGEQRTVCVSYPELSGDPMTRNNMGGFLYDGSKVRVQDDVLYLAATCFSETRGAVIAAWNMTTHTTEYFQMIEDTQVMTSRWQKDGVQVLLNHNAYSPLELRTIDFTRQHPDSSVQMPLPPEFEQDQTGPETYLLFKAQVGRLYTAVLYPDRQHMPEQPDDLRRMVLAVYSNQDGSPVSRTALQINGRYDIYEIRLHEPALLLQPLP